MQLHPVIVRCETVGFPPPLSGNSPRSLAVSGGRGRQASSELEPLSQAISLCLLDSLAFVLPGTVASTEAVKTVPIPLCGSEDQIDCWCLSGPALLVLVTPKTLRSYGVWAQISPLI